MSKAASDYFDFYLEGKPPTRSRVKPTDGAKANTNKNVDLPWQIRNVKLSESTDSLQITQDKKANRQTPFLARNGVNLAGRVAAKVVVRATGKGAISFSWRTSKDDAFSNENRVSIVLKESSEWQTVEATLPGDSRIVHVRVQVPGGVTTIKCLELTPASGQPVA